MNCITQQQALDALKAFQEAHQHDLNDCNTNDCLTFKDGRERPRWSYKGINQPLYRWVMIAKTGTVETGDFVVARHTCDNPKCFSPDHIIRGTRADNNGDRAWKHYYK